MTTLRQFILNGSALATGNTVRQHLNNPKTSTGTLIISSDLSADIDCELSANITNSMSADIKTDALTANIDLALSAQINQTREADLWQ